MNLSVLFISLLILLPALAQSQQYGAFGPVPDCNCESVQPTKRRQQEAPARSVPRVAAMTQSELNVVQKRMAQKIVAAAGREANPRALVPKPNQHGPTLGFAIVITETTLDVDGNVLNVEFVRRAGKATAQDTNDLAVSAIHKASPFSEITNGVSGLKILQTFVFWENKQFYLDALRDN